MRNRPLLLLIILAIAASLVVAFQLNSPQKIVDDISTTKDVEWTRRGMLLQQGTNFLGFLVAAGATASIPIAAVYPANAMDVIRSPGKCANGEGDACATLADNNELIRSLQKKSAENREANQRVRGHTEYYFVGLIKPLPNSLNIPLPTYFCYILISRNISIRNL